MSALVPMSAASALASWAVALWVLGRAGRLGLVQQPNHRSSHEKPTPCGGGLGIVAAGTVATAWFAWQGSPWLWAALGLAAPLAVTGYLDDVRHLSARVRFGVQLAVCAGLLTVLNVPGWPELRPWGGLAAWALAGCTLLAGAWWVNLFNFMDGIDGIASAQALFMLVAASVLCVLADPSSGASGEVGAMVCLASAVAGFLALNWPPARIFMGDVGSTWAAFMVFALALATVRAGWMAPGAWAILGAAFVADATVTLLARMARGEPWRQAHRSHAYQRLSRRWQGPRKAGHLRVTLLLLAVDMLWLAPLAWACQCWPGWTAAWVSLAYVPLAAAAFAAGAGRPDHAL